MKTKLLLILFFTATLSAQNEPLTLEKSIELGLQNNRLIKISEAKVVESEAKVREVNSLLFPKVSFSATYARLSEVPPFEVNIPIMPASIKIQDAILNNYSLKASLQQPLFTGFRLSSAKSAAELNNKAVIELHSAELNTTALTISTAYWNFFRTEKFVELAEKSVARTELLLKDTKNFLDNGLVTKSDYLKIEVLHSNNKLLLLESNNNLKLARASLNKEIGLDLNAKTEIAANIPVVEISNYNLEELLKEGSSERNEIKSFSYRLAASTENVTAANSGWFPNVALFGNYYYSNPNQRIMPLEEKFYDTWDVGVSLNWTLWDWGETSAKSEQAEQQKIQVENSLENIKNAIHLEIYSTYLTLKKEYDKVALNKIAFQQAKENLKITREQYSVQMSSASDLADSETSLLRAETNLISSKIDFELAKIRLNKAVGRRIY